MASSGEARRPLDDPPLLVLEDIVKVYGTPPVAVRALDGISLEIERGEFVAITGASGSGKSTAVSILGCLESPTSGEYRIEGVPVQDLPPNVLAALRNARFGFVFQTFNLLPRTSALDNVALPLVYADVPGRERRQRAAAALEAVGLPGRDHARPNQLSGGEQQRLAIARAIVNNPAILLADEPTGNLDSRNGQAIMQLITRLNQERGITAVMVTHDSACAAYAPRQVVFRDGRIVSDDRKVAA